MGYTWQYYDLVLLGIALSITVGGAVGVLTAVPLTTAVIVACLFAAALVGHGLFVNGPVDEFADLADEVDALD
ncbi:hypothetical protein [Halomarina litorea]|uniref:hypothetical protein n=1 Tax=Halomarina litorea TaxID=2961595 RepID=UPI0020C2F8CF|nr:hypothetical protein [Halomarina sp. BCD28]